VSGQVAAFFDMDHTVVLCNTGRVYLQDMRRRGQLRWRDMLRASAVFLRYKLSMVDMSRVIAEAVKNLEGVSVEELEARCEAIFQERVKSRVSQEAAAVIEDHRARGHRIVMLTAQTPYMAAPVCRALGIEDCLSTELEVVDGRFTGLILRPACYGAGKCHWAAQYAETHGVDLAASYFYTDSYSDVPMLEQVAHQRVVNPDPRLRLHARRRQWPVLHFAS